MLILISVLTCAQLKHQANIYLKKQNKPQKKHNKTKTHHQQHGYIV